eukprot:TRINITY_DN10016_c0_g1_i3.p1 TRINITY_DN10016_c0_g1~~TRINITY_DN10016_c0_g1_i3.p1  ORF type:complete len:833 (-),score=155.56 TRINITY_DN10016_c0_g1_i3:251-2749(-)
MEDSDQLQERLWLKNLQVELGGTFTWAYEELEDSFSINGDRYTIKSLLGEGTFGTVYHCTCEAIDGGCVSQDVAVKIISTERISIITGCSKQSVIRRMLHEAEILGCLGGHPHIVQLHCAAISQTSLRIFMVMQLLRCTDLFNELLRRRKAFPEEETRQIVRQLAMAVSHCHRRQIAHRDIKLENIMLASRHPPVLKLIDFGQAQMQGMNLAAVSKSDQTAKTLTTSSLYTPPDVKQAIQENAAYDAFKLDAFGIGVICYALLCSSLPEAAKGGDFQKGPKWKALSANAQDLILQLLCSDADDRLSVAEVLQHPFVTTVGSSSLSSQVTTPCDFEHELQALMTSQALVKALQQERGASCWMLDGSKDAEMRCRWMCEATNDHFHEAIGALQTLPCEKGTELAQTLMKIRSDVETIRMVCRQSSEQGEEDGHCSFDTVFATYCKINEEVIHLIGRLIVTIQKHEASLTVAEVRIRLLLLVAEQLGRERGFICGHLRRRDLLMSWPVQRRFAKIQGCRQYLLGSTSPESAESGVVSFETGLLPNLRLVSAPLISRRDLEVLEEAETAVLGWKSTASEWFTIITELIDKVHQQASVAFLGLIQEMGRQVSVSPTPPLGNLSVERGTPQSQRETTPPSQSAGPSDNSMSDRANSTFNSVPTGFHQQRPSDYPRAVGSSSRPPGTYLHEDFLPMKVTASSFGGSALDTPEATPLHPGLWQGCGLNFLQSASLLPSVGRQMERTFQFQGTLSPPQTLPPPTPTGMLEQQPAQAQREVVISTGTMGHPISCRGLGCKFASKDRGCKEGDKCQRCHLCLWKRAPEKDAQRLQQGLMMKSL